MNEMSMNADNNDDYKGNLTSNILIFQQEQEQKQQHEQQETNHNKHDQNNKQISSFPVPMSSPILISQEAKEEENHHPKILLTKVRVPEQPSTLAKSGQPETSPSKHSEMRCCTSDDIPISLQEPTNNNNQDNHNDPHSCSARQEMLWGREKEWKSLFQAYNLAMQTNNTQPQLILLTGSSGTGKTALADHLLQHHCEQQNSPSRNFYGTGKFDLLASASLSDQQHDHQQKPFAPFVQAMTQFVHQLNDQDIQIFKNKLQKHGNHLSESSTTSELLDEQLLIDMIPALGILLSINQNEAHRDDGSLVSSSRKHTAFSLSNNDTTTIGTHLTETHRTRFLQAFAHLLQMLFLDPTMASTPQEKEANEQDENQIIQHNKQHHFVLFLDDLQWADKSSLELLHDLVLLSSLQHQSATTNIVNKDRNCDNDCMGGRLIIIGACRSNEVSVDDHLSSMLRSLESPQYLTRIVVIPLSNWTLEQSNSYIAHQILKLPDESETLDLSTMMYRQGKGNIFFLRRYLINMFHSGGFSHDGTRFHWDQRYLEENIGTKTAAELISIDLERLHGNGFDLHVLKIASCLGASLEKELLGWIVDDLSSESPLSLDEMISRFLGEGTWICKKMGDGKALLFAFSHDQIQLGCYSLIPDAERSRFHLDLGERLKTILMKKDKEEPQNRVWDRYLFVLASQFVRGLHEIKDQRQVYDTALLFLQAGQKAVKLASFGTALTYMKAGIKCLGSRAWSSNGDFYSISLVLFNAAAEVAYCNSDHAIMEYFVQKVLKNAKNDRDKLQAYSTQIVAYSTQQRLKEAINLGFYVLRMLGEPVPSNAGSKLSILKEILKTRRMLRKFCSTRDILDLAPMTNEDKVAIMKILDLVFISILFGQPEFTPFVGCRIVQLTLKYGLNVVSASGFVLYGVLCCSAGLGGDRNDGYKYGGIGLDILEKFKSKHWLPRVYCAYYGGIHAMREPMANALPHLEKASLVGQKTGDFEFAAMNAFMNLMYKSAIGYSIVAQVEEGRSFCQMMMSHGQVTTLSLMRPVIQSLANLNGQYYKDLMELTGEFMNQEEHIEFFRKANNYMAELVFELSRLFVAFYVGEHKRGECLCESLGRRIGQKQRPGMTHAAISFIESTFACVLYRDEQLTTAKYRRRQRRRLVCARRGLKQLQQLARDCPHNFLDRASFLEAELLFIAGYNKGGTNGKLYDAIAKYRLAIALSKKEGYTSQEAIYNERLGVTYLSSSYSKRQEGIGCLKRARDLYNKWGAVVAADRLDSMLQDLGAAYR